jgi:hypothetical protein
MAERLRTSPIFMRANCSAGQTFTSSSKRSYPGQQKPFAP